MRFHFKPAYLGFLALAASTPEARAASAVLVVPSQPHPQQILTVSGTGFGNSEAIDVYFDTTDTLLLVTSATGTFSATLTVPSSAAPGRHYATAIGRHSGDAAQIALTVTTAWAELGFGHAHYGSNPYENTLNTSNAGSLSLLWGTATGAILSAPTVESGRVFTSGTGISALSTVSGSVLWSVDTTDSFYSTPAVYNNVVYAASVVADSLYAVSATNGAKKWTATLGDTSRSSPVVVNGTVYIGCNDSKVYALNAVTGAILWTYTTGDQVVSSPAVDDGIVYVGSIDTKLYALDAKTGTLVWSYTTGGIIYSPPAVANGVVYIGAYDHNLYAIQAGLTGGGQLWTAQTSGNIYAAPAVVGHKVIVGSEDGYEYAYDARTGALQWEVNTGAPVDGTAAIANGVAYVGNNAGEVLAIDISYGGIIGSMSAPPYVVAPIAVSDGVVYFTGEYSKTYAYALGGDTGQVRPPVHAPAISGLHPDMRLAVTK